MKENVKNGSGDSEQQVAMLLETGYEEWLMNNFEKAIEVFEEVLENDSDNYKAIFYRLLSIAQANEESPIESFVNDFIPIADDELDRVVNLIRMQNNSDQDFTEECVEFAVELSIVCCGSLILLDKYDEETKSLPKSQIVLILNGFLLKIIGLVKKPEDACDGFYEMLAKYMKGYENHLDYTTANLYNKTNMVVLNNCKSDVVSADVKLSTTRTEEFTKKIESLLNENKEAEVLFYELEKVVKEKLAKIHEDFECEESKEKEKLSDDIDLLIKQKNELSFFKFKEKRRFQMIIDEKTDYLNELEEIIDDKKKDRDAELLKEANENHEKAGEYMRKISRNRQLADAYKSNAGVWFSFNTIGFARGKEE